MESIRIPLRVAVIYSSGGKVTPKWFELGRRKYEIKETTYFWRDQIGEVPHMHYAVSDGQDLYELVFNTCDQTWTVQTVKSVQP